MFVYFLCVAVSIRPSRLRIDLSVLFWYCLLNLYCFSHCFIYDITLIMMYVKNKAKDMSYDVKKSIRVCYM